MKRHSPLEDHADRAAKCLKAGFLRIDIARLGFWKENRGGTGCNGFHTHEVAQDCKANKTKLMRYQYVIAVKIPANRLEEVRRYNKDKCETDPLMPRYSPTMEFVCGTKTHFVHGQKLAKDGGRTLFNEGEVEIKWQTGDTEGIEIMENGVMACIAGEELFDDIDALHALSSDDNLNAQISWGEDEMQGFGRVHELVTRLSAPSQSVDALKTLTASRLESGGLGSFTLEAWMCFFRLRAQVGPKIALALTTVQFSLCSGRVRVRYTDFGEAARLDPRAPWSSASLILFAYLGNMDQSKKVSTCVTFEGRVVKHAKPMQHDAITELVGEPAFVLSVHNFINSMLQKYTGAERLVSKDTSKAAHDLMQARGEIVANSGKHLLKVGAALEQAVKRATAQKRTLGVEARLCIVEEECHNKFAKAEDFYRTELVKKGIYTQDDLPTPLHVLAVSAKPVANAPSQGGLTAVKHEPISEAKQAAKALSQCGAPVGVAAGSAGEVAEPPVLTEAHVYNRLDVKGCGEYAMAYMKFKATPNVKEEQSADTSPQVDVSESKKPAEGAWCKVKLVSISMPEAVVVVVEGKHEGHDFTCHVDGLRAFKALPDLPKTKVHPTAVVKGKTLDAYDYQLRSDSSAFSLVESAVLWAHMSSRLCVQGLCVWDITDGDKLPITLQVRAKVPFRKGTLVLAPAYGQCKRTPTMITEQQPDIETVAKEHTGVLHASMLLKVPLFVTITGKTDRQVIAASSDEAPKETPKGNQTGKQIIREKHGFDMFSPLLEGKLQKNRATSMENLPPFWAVLRYGSPKAVHNMKIETVPFSDLGFDVQGTRYPQLDKSLEFLAYVPILRNTSDIEKGDILCLPMFD